MKNIISFGIFLVSGFIYYFILRYIINILDVFYDSTIYLLIVGYVLFGYSLSLKNKKYIFISYIANLIILLFSRTTTSGINFKFYLFDWSNIILSNKIVMINIIGNILIFIPLGYFLHKQLLIAIFIVILFEILQYLFDKGIADIVDVVLNIIGCIIGKYMEKLICLIKKNKQKKQEKKSKK